MTIPYVCPMKIEIEDPQVASSVAKDEDLLRSLCQKEATKFSRYLRETQPNFPDGLVKWEAHIIAVYLFHNLGGALNATTIAGLLSEEGQDGQA